MSRISSSSFKVNSDLEQIVSVANTTAIPVTDSSVLSKLTEIDTNTTGLNNCVSGTELQVDIVACTPTINVSDSASQGSLSSIATNTTGLAGCVQGNELQCDIVSSTSIAVTNSDLADLGGCVAGGRVLVTTEGGSASNSGSAGNLSNAASTSNGSFSSEVDTRTGKNITIIGTTSDTGGTAIKLQVSASSGSGFVEWGYQIYPDSNGNFSLHLNGVALNYIKLEYGTTATVTATCLFN